MYTGYGAGLANKRSLVHVLAVPLSGNNLRQVVHTLVPLSPSSKSGTSQRAVTPCGWEGNRRSGVALAMRHRLQWFIHLRTHGLRKVDEHPAYTPHRVWHTLPLPCGNGGEQATIPHIAACCPLASHFEYIESTTGALGMTGPPFILCSLGPQESAPKPAHLQFSSFSGFTVESNRQLDYDIPSVAIGLINNYTLFSRTTWTSRYQKGKSSLDLNKAREDGVLGCSGISQTRCKQSAPH